jgi:isocitrate dehydrogenase kinase/phosphatase
MYTGTRGIKNDAPIQNGINLFRTRVRIFITQTQLPLVFSLPVGVQIDQQIYAPVKNAIFGMIRIEIRVELQKPLRFNSMYTRPMQRKFITNNVVHASNLFNMFYKIGTI